MSDDVTYCEDCDNMLESSRKGPSWAAMCSKFKRLFGTQLVARGVWDKDHPYMMCRDINGGDCPLFTPRRTK
jgi:hypothetical protein